MFLQGRLYIPYDILTQWWCLFLILIGHGNQNRIVQFIQITVPDHRTDQCIDRYIKVYIFQIHIIQDRLRILIKRIRLQYFLVPVDGKLNTRIDIDANHRIDTVILVKWNTAS